ncbi:hypothetical protein [Pleurocapsa sp. FMAR1]|uniref:hypothetical protein n=1 Tax=Pleurocapsa sp. FMAR1 TaxID=3040204 RepID=UPI0029C67DBE|nr:hypothetical protein [Pleurocapsa sp. FMAR1]
MDRSKLIAIVTGVISILIAIAYLVVVQLLDFRGEMIPAPVSQLSTSTVYSPSTITSTGGTPATVLSRNGSYKGFSRMCRNVTVSQLSVISY